MGKSVRTIQGTDEEVTAQIKEIAAEDKKSESTKNWGCAVAVVAALAGGVPAYMGTNLPGPLVGLLCVIGVVGLVMIAKGSAGDVDDSRYHALLRLHRFLVGDCDRNSQYHYVMDLRSYTHSAFFSHADKFGSMFSLPKGKVEHFDCPVIYGQVKLRDGTLLSMNVNRLTRRTTRTKRGYSGKVKTKTKSKYAARYSMKAKLPEGAPEVPATSSVPIARSHGARPPKFKGNGNKVAATTVAKNLGDDLKIEDLLKLMTHTFHQVFQNRQASS